MDTNIDIFIASDGQNSVELCAICLDKANHLYNDVQRINEESEWDRNPVCDHCGKWSFTFTPTDVCLAEFDSMLRQYLVERYGNKDFLDEVAEHIVEVSGYVDHQFLAELYLEVREYERNAS